MLAGNKVILFSRYGDVLQEESNEKQMTDVHGYRVPTSTIYKLQSLSFEPLIEIKNNGRTSRLHVCSNINFQMRYRCWRLRFSDFSM